MILSYQRDVTERGVGKRDIQSAHKSWCEPALVAHLGYLGKGSFGVLVPVEAGRQMQEWVGGQ